MRLRYIWTCLLALLIAPMANAQDTGTAKSGDATQGGQAAVKAKPADKSAGQKGTPAKPKADNKKSKKADDDEEKPAAPPKEPTAPKLIVTPGYSDWALRGPFKNKFLQYATPPEGWFLKELRYNPAIGHNNGYGLISIKAPGQEDYRYDAQLALNHGATKSEGWITRNQFFDSTPVFIGPSERKIQEITAKQQIGRGFGVSTRYRMDEQNQILEPPRDEIHQRTRYTDLIAEGKLGNGFLSLGVTDWRFFDRTGIEPDTSILRYNASYLWEPVKTVGLEGSYVKQDIKQSGDRPTSHVETTALRSDIAVTPNTDLGLLLKRERRDFAVTQNAYVTQKRVGGLSFQHRWPRWNIQLGLREAEADRLRDTHDFVDVPRWTTFDGRVSGRLTKDIRASLRGMTQHLSRVPGVTVEDARSLFFDDRSSASLALNGSFKNVNAYFQSGWNRQDNSARSVRVESIINTLGVNWDFGPMVSAFVEITKENWHGASEIVEAPTLDNFAPDVRTSVVGVNWTVDQRTFLWATVTYFVTDNDNPLLLPNGNTNGTFISFNLRHQFNRGSEVGLVLAPWTYNDSTIVGRGYNALVLMVTGSAKF